MNRLIEILFERVPYFEIFSRKLYYIIKETIEKDREIISKTSKVIEPDEKAKEFFVDSIASFGIKKGDVLIVHSGLKELKITGMKANEILDYLLSLVGKEGTLILPAYPDFSTNDSAEIFYYDPKSTKSWTGYLPNLFCTKDGVIRSALPANPLACFGKYAEEITQGNEKAIYPHGENSSWFRAVMKHAKILFIGTNIAHSNTVIHVAEDVLGEDYPIKNWYESKSYKVNINNEIKLITVRERRQFWSRYINESRNTYRLKKKGLAIEKYEYGMHLGFIQDSYDVFEEIYNRAQKEKLEYVIPKKYWRCAK